MYVLTFVVIVDIKVPICTVNEELHHTYIFAFVLLVTHKSFRSSYDKGLTISKDF